MNCSFEHPEEMFKLMDKKIELQFYAKIFGLTGPMDTLWVAKGPTFLQA